MAVDTLILGHSFVNRLDAFCVDNFIQNFALHHGDVRVSISGIGGLHVGQMYSSFNSTVRDVSPRSVILQIGSNDLSDGRCPLSVAHDIVEYVEYLHYDCNVAHLFVCQMLPRYSQHPSGRLWGRWRNGRRTLAEITQDQVHDATFRANHYVETMLDSTFSSFRTLNTLNTAPAYMFYDGTHLDQNGMWRYFREIRGIVMKSIYV